MQDMCLLTYFCHRKSMSFNGNVRASDISECLFDDARSSLSTLVQRKSMQSTLRTYTKNSEFYLSHPLVYGHTL